MWIHAYGSLPGRVWLAQSSPILGFRSCLGDLFRWPGWKKMILVILEYLTSWASWGPTLPFDYGLCVCVFMLALLPSDGGQGARVACFAIPWIIGGSIHSSYTAQLISQHALLPACCSTHSTFEEPLGQTIEILFNTVQSIYVGGYTVSSAFNCRFFTRWSEWGIFVWKIAVARFGRSKSQWCCRLCRSMRRPIIWVWVVRFCITKSGRSNGNLKMAGLLVPLLHTTKWYKPHSVADIIDTT